MLYSPFMSLPAILIILASTFSFCLGSFTFCSFWSIRYKEKYGIDISTKIGTLSDKQLNDLEGIIKEPLKYNIPKFLANRNKDLETGEDMHVVGTDLIVKTRFDIDTGIKLQSWVGSRHQYGQKARGQRTRNTGRTGATIGVIKKSAQPAQAPAKKPE